MILLYYQSRYEIASIAYTISDLFVCNVKVDRNKIRWQKPYLPVSLKQSEIKQ